MGYDSLKASAQLQFEEGGTVVLTGFGTVITENMMRQKMTREQTAWKTNRTQEESVDTIPELNNNTRIQQQNCLYQQSMATTTSEWQLVSLHTLLNSRHAKPS